MAPLRRALAQLPTIGPALVANQSMPPKWRVIGVIVAKKHKTKDKSRKENDENKGNAFKQLNGVQPDTLK